MFVLCHLSMAHHQYGLLKFSSFVGVTLVSCVVSLCNIGVLTYLLTLVTLAFFIQCYSYIVDICEVLHIHTNVLTLILR